MSKWHARWSEKLEDDLQPQRDNTDDRILFFGALPVEIKLPARPLYTVSCSGLKLRLIKYLFVHAVFLGEVNHRLDIFRLCLIKERPIAHDKTTAFASSIDKFLGVSSHIPGCP